MLQCSGVPPRALDVCRGRALLGGGSPSPSLSPPLAAACVRRARPFGGSPLLRLSAVGFMRRARASGVFVPLLLLSLYRALFRGPMAVLSCHRPRAGRTSLQRLRRYSFES